MLIVKLQGGPGNQMFQYAFGLSLSKKLHAQLYLDLSFYDQNHGLTPRNFALDIFGCQTKVADSKTLDSFLHPGLLRRMLNKAGLNEHTIYREKTMKFDKGVFDTTPPAYFEGFWQTEQYFRSIETEVRSAFAFKMPLNQQSKTIAGELAQQHNAVSVHVRRGDYVTSTTTNELHGVCSVKYYLTAIASIKQKVTNPRFYFFSDDPEWVEQQLLPETDNAAVIRHNRGADSWQDMALMSKCSHHIIANSSFSWWGAWLNPRKGKIVIAPRDWFAKETPYFDARDIVPPGWLRIAND